MRAREILGSGASVVSQAVERLEQERAASARRSAELLASREEVERERASLPREWEGETRAGARAELIEDLRRRRDEIAALVARLQAAPAMAQAVDAQRAVEQAVAAEEREQARASEPQALPGAG